MRAQRAAVRKVHRKLACARIKNTLIPRRDLPARPPDSAWHHIYVVCTFNNPLSDNIITYTHTLLYPTSRSLSQPPPLSPKYDQHQDHRNRHHQQQQQHQPPMHFSHIHRALGGETATSSATADAAAAAANFVPTNESLANLFDEVNALFDASPTTATTALDAVAANEHEDHHHHRTTPTDESEDSDDDIDGIDGVGDGDDDDAAAAAAHCKFRDICEMSVLGAAPHAHVVHRMLWTLANEYVCAASAFRGVNDVMSRSLR